MKILLTGAAGLLGDALLRQLAARHTLLATYNRTPLLYNSPAIAPVQLDLLNESDVVALIAEHPVELVINCAGAVDVDRCESDHNYALRGNQDLVANLLVAQQRRDFRLIHISTDYVFAGKSGPPDESAIPDPINFYGRSKLAGEELIRQAAAEACIVRVCALYSVAADARPNLYSRILGTLRQGDNFPAATDLMTNPTEVNVLATALVSLIEKAQLPPLIHLAAPEYLSRYGFALQIARRNGLDGSLVRRVTSDEIDFVAPRPKQAGLDSSRAASEFDLRLKSFPNLPNG